MDHSPGTPSISIDSSVTSLATGEIDPTSSKRWRRSGQPTGLGWEVSKARISSISTVGMTGLYAPLRCSNVEMLLLPSFSQVRRQQITGIVIEQASAPRLIATGTPDGNRETAAFASGVRAIRPPTKAE